jgi:hypothetical protein
MKDIAAKVKRISEERVGGMVPRELLLKDKEMVYVVEYSVEVGGQQTGFDYLSHLGVTLPVQIE